MITIKVEDFFVTDNLSLESIKEAMARLSIYCEIVDTPISIVSENGLKIFGNNLLYPNVVYVDFIDMVDEANMSIVFPHLKKIGDLYTHGEILDMGQIDEVDGFYYLTYYMRQSDCPLDVEVLGDDKYLFKSETYSRVIKINDYE